jgi:hypothetical protein
MVKSEENELEIQINAKIKNSSKWKAWSKNKKISGGSSDGGGKLGTIKD